MSRVIVRGERIVFPDGERPGAICIEDGIIQSTGEINDFPVIEGDRLIDAANHVVMAGMIDVHVHINEPGRTDWEGFETATKAAAMGGSTLLVDMPLNSTPVTTTVENFQLKLDAAEGKLAVNVCLLYTSPSPRDS